MAKLTSQQEKFAQLVAAGSNQSDAYRGAYNTSKMLPKSVTEKASELMANVNVSSRVRELRQPVVDAVRAEAKITLESHLAEIERIKGLALQKEEYNVALKAEELRGKAVGLYVNKTEDVTDPVKKAMGRMKPEDAVSALEALRQIKSIRERAKQDA